MLGGRSSGFKYYHLQPTFHHILYLCWYVSGFYLVLLAILHYAPNHITSSLFTTLGGLMLDCNVSLSSQNESTNPLPIFFNIYGDPNN